MIGAILGRIGEAARTGRYRGCPFLNAAAGDPAPAVTAPLLVALSDGLLEIAYLDARRR
jgi:hypothetical protein